MLVSDLMDTVFGPRTKFILDFSVVQKVALISHLTGYSNTASVFALSLLPSDIPSVWTRVSAAEGTF